MDLPSRLARRSLLGLGRLVAFACVLLLPAVAWAANISLNITTRVSGREVKVTVRNTGPGPARVTGAEVELAGKRYPLASLGELAPEAEVSSL